MTDQSAQPTSPSTSLEARSVRWMTSDGSVVVPPRIAKWLDKQTGMTADRRARLFFADPEAFEVLYALHRAARSERGTETVAGQRNTKQSETWLSTNEAAKALHVTDRCVRKWCKAGRLDAVLAGSRWLVNPNSIALQTEP